MAEQKTISAAELSAFCSEVSLMLSSGLPLFDGMEALAEAYAASPNAELYRRASETVLRTGSLYEALKEDGRWPSHLAEMAGIGERTGRLEEVMRGLTDYYERESRIRASIRSAVAYPLVLGVIMVMIILVMLIQVLPVFRRILGSMGAALSSSGSMLVSIGSAVGWVVLIAVGLLTASLLLVVALTRTRKREAVLQTLRRLFRPVRLISTKLAASRVSSVLSMMLSGGFPLDEALALIPPVLSDQTAIAAVENIRRAMEAGTPFGDAVAASGLYDEIYCRMIRMGVVTGREDQVMARIAAVYEEQVEESISHLVSIIEPTLVAALCIVIGGILLSIVLPIAGIITSIL